MSNSVKDRSGVSMPPKAERRALGKAAAAKRAAQRRRKQLLTKIGKIAAPFGLVLLVIGAVWLFTGSDSPPASPQAENPSAENTTAPATALPPDADPALATKPVVTAGDPVTALGVTSLITGTGAPTAAGQEITVNYVGVTLATGVEFDSSWSRNDTFSFTLGQGGVIQGWDQGLVGIPVGSRVQLDVPVALAYPGGGGPEGDLRFVVDILNAA